MSEITTKFGEMIKVSEPWTDITINKLLDELEKFKLDGNTNKTAFHNKSRASGSLYKSLKGNVIYDTDGVPKSITIEFLAYGRYVDMGVGNGTPIGAKGNNAFAGSRNEKGQLLKYKRKAQKWYSSRKGKEVSKLRRMLVLELGQTALADIESSFKENGIVLNL